MKALIVTAHPQPDSFTQALARRFADGIVASGHEAEIANLYEEGFNPVVSLPELEGWHQDSISAEIRAWQERICNNDGLVLVYPVWWGTPPAILSGWLQRVFTRGFAFVHTGGNTIGQIRLRAQMLVNIGSRKREDIDLATLYIEPLLGVLRYCGMETLPTQSNWGVYPGADQIVLSGHMEAAFENGKRFFP